MENKVNNSLTNFHKNVICILGKPDNYIPLYEKNVSLGCEYYFKVSRRETNTLLHNINKLFKLSSFDFNITICNECNIKLNTNEFKELINGDSILMPHLTFERLVRDKSRAIRFYFYTRFQTHCDVSKLGVISFRFKIGKDL